MLIIIIIFRFFCIGDPALLIGVIIEMPSGVIYISRLRVVHVISIFVLLQTAIVGSLNVLIMAGIIGALADAQGLPDLRPGAGSRRRGHAVENRDDPVLPDAVLP